MDGIVMASVVINDVIPRSQFTATGGQTVFDTTWTIDDSGASVSDEEQVKVFARAAGVDANDDTQEVSTVDYNVSLVGASQTVRVTFTSGRTAGDIITIIRATPVDRQNLYSNTNFTPSMLNGDFGRVVLNMQQNQLDRNAEKGVGVRYNYSEELTLPDDQILPRLGARQGWRKNAADNAIEAYDLPDGDVAPADATYLLQTADSDLPNAQAMGALASGFVVNTTTTGVQLSRVLTGTANQISIVNSNGISGNPTFSIVNNPIIPGTERINIPRGTTAQRPSVPIAGDSRFNTDLQALEVYSTSGGWDALSGGVVDSVTGTANEVSVDNTDPINPIIGLPSDVIVSNSLQAGNLKLEGNTLSSENANGNINLDPNGSGRTRAITDANRPLDLARESTTQPFTAFVPADVLGSFALYTPNDAGLVIQGFSTSASNRGLRLQGHSGNATVTIAPSIFESYKTNGTTGRIPLSGTEPAFSWYVGDSFSGGTHLMTLLANGGLNLGAGSSLFTLNSTTGVNGVNNDPTLASASATTLSTDTAIKQYVDSRTDLTYMLPVQAASTANFASTYNNGTSGVGATLTATSNGAFTLDGQAGVLNARYLMKNQTTTFQNGIYTLTQVGDGSNPAILTRATDFDQPSEIDAGDIVPVLNGTTNGSTSWLQTATVNTIGTDAITFTQWSASLANVVTINGTQTVIGAKTFSANTNITGQLGLGLSAANTARQLDILASSTPLGLRVTGSVTNNANKLFKLGSRHYQNAEEDVMWMYGLMQNTTNRLLIGGGSSLQNACTSVEFFLGATSTTTSGTKVAEFTSVGLLMNNAVVRLASYTVAGVPSASTSGAGAQIYVSNESGGAVPAFSDGTSWRRVTDRAVIS